jgi:hypothetical protein
MRVARVAYGIGRTGAIVVVVVVVVVVVLLVIVFM